MMIIKSNKVKEDEMIIENKILMRGLIVIILVMSIIGIVNYVSAVETVVASDPTICCETTQSGLFCQNVRVEQCAPDSRKIPTSCSQTSFCKPGYCYDSNEGTCTTNTPQFVCNDNGGTWTPEQPAQCDLGCCVLGDQAAFVTLVRCKRLSASLGLQTNYNPGINDEVSCLISVQNQDKGACVYDFEFERTCRFTTRQECSEGVGETNEIGEFYEGKLCSAEELGTNCGPSRETTCLPGKEEVYFLDTCGNPANIYDASKINDKTYWSDVVFPSESCNPSSANANSRSCGNCNYLLGSTCRSSTGIGQGVTYGNNICADLNCENTANGNDYLHGESWCVNDDFGTTDEGENSVGSRFYRHLCINGQEVLEQCDDFRQQECIEATTTSQFGTFTQSACKANRWQDCAQQTNQTVCENSDVRDCIWREGIALANGTETKGRKDIEGACLPKNTPGLQFWEGEEAASVCSQGNYQCIVTFEKPLIGDEECVDNCECLEKDWVKERADICSALGDCGPSVNWIGKKGFGSGYEVEEGKVK